MSQQITKRQVVRSVIFGVVLVYITAFVGGIPSGHLFFYYISAWNIVAGIFCQSCGQIPQPLPWFVSTTGTMHDAIVILNGCIAWLLLLVPFIALISLFVRLRKVSK